MDAIEAQPRVYEDLRESDWQVASCDEREWQADVDRLNSAYRQLKERLKSMSEEDLSGMSEPYQGKPRYATAFRFVRTATPRHLPPRTDPLSPGSSGALKERYGLESTRAHAVQRTKLDRRASEMTRDQDQRVRMFVFRETAETARVPAVSAIADALDLPVDDVQASLNRLAAGRVLVLAPGTTNIWMAHPFSAVPTAFRVVARGRTYFGNCIWDALGIPAILDADATVETMCADCGDPMTLEVRSGTLARAGVVVHFGVPAARWWDNIGYT